MFQTSGLIAGIAKWSCALRIPTVRPLRPRMSTTGKSTRDRPTQRSCTACSSSPTKSGITTPAPTTKSTVSAPRTVKINRNSVDASRNASRRRPCSSSSVKTGTKAALRAASAKRLRTTFGTWKASVKAEKPALVPKKLDATISRTSPAIREKPVAMEKTTVLRAMARAGAGEGARAGPGGAASVLDTAARCYGPVPSDRPNPQTGIRRGQAHPSRYTPPSRHGQHPLAEEAHPARRARTAREPPLHVDREDLLPAAAGGAGERRPADRAGRAPAAGPDDRQGRQARRPAPQHGRAQEVPRRPSPARRRRGVARARRRGRRSGRSDPADRANRHRVLVELTLAAGGELELGQRLQRPAERGGLRGARLLDPTLGEPPAQLE